MKNVVEWLGWVRHRSVGLCTQFSVEHAFLGVLAERERMYRMTLQLFAESLPFFFSVN
jgi:hypothetical protein